MEKKNLSINTKNILPIIKRALYSEKEIFLRELISNASDASLKLKILKSKGEYLDSTDFRIDITTDKKNKTLSMEDHGLGMNKEEVEKYIGEIAFSSAYEFIEKYETQGEEDNIIGHFGLGFFSVFMVAKKVEIETLSYKKGSEAILFSSDGGEIYALGKSKKNQVGTKIILHLDEESLEFLETPKITSILNRYCPFLSYPIFINGEKVLMKEPLYLKKSPEIKEEEYLDFFKSLYPLEEEPLFSVHLDVEVPFHLKGILFFPRKSPNEMVKRKIKLFCNKIFVSDDISDILKDFLSLFLGVLDSTDIPLNVSRSNLQIDPKISKLTSYIIKKIGDRLLQIFQKDFQKFTSLWPDIESMVKFGILQEEKFYEKAKNFLIFKTNKDQFLTLDELIKTAKEKKIYYALPDSSFLKIFKDRTAELIYSSSFFDSFLFSFLESKCDITFERIDSSIDSSLIDASKEKTLLDVDGKSEQAKMVEFVQEALNHPKMGIEVKSLLDVSMPAFFLFPEKARRLQEALSLSQKEQLPISSNFIINSNHPLIEKTFLIQKKKPEIAKTLIQQLFDLAKLTSGEQIEKEELLKNSHHLMEITLEALLKKD